MSCGNIHKVMKLIETLGGGKRRHNVADTNVSPFARARNICCGHKILSETQKMFLISFRNILCLQQMFPGLRSIETIMSNNVSATLCPLLPPPFDSKMSLT